jgi:hypothetical protein
VTGAASPAGVTVPDAAPPARLAAHLPTGTGHPGEIVVIDTATGAIVRTLGAEYDPYLANGFQMAPDGSAVYYTRLNGPSQKIELVRAPLDGSPLGCAGRRAATDLQP